MPGQEFVDARTLRRMFNDGRYWERVLVGQLTAIVGENRHPGPSFEPYCAVSQIVRYHTVGQERVAVVHQYVRPDGTIGGSGRPDPKAISADGVLYILDPNPSTSQQPPGADTGNWGRLLVRWLVRPITRIIMRMRTRSSQ